MKNKAGRNKGVISEKSAVQTRRTTLRRLLAGSTLAGAAAALPSRWTRPVVQSVLLPAHAQLSGEPDGDFLLAFVTERSRRSENVHGYAKRGSGQSGWLDLLVPNAHAGTVNINDCFACNLCGRLRSGQITVSLTFTPPAENTLLNCYEATGDIGDTVNPGFVSGTSLECVIPSVSIISLDGEAPNRTLAVAVGGEEHSLLEDPSRTC
ncbi:MAG TPA: hypothetical protein VK973_04570, partial [Arenicellales bacterium]|nr:hypothetical protein [Arenicellales bacterium]